MRLDDVVEALEVLDVDRRDHVDAGVEQLVDVLPALLVARARGRWCGPARRPARPSGRRARTASRSISSSGRAAVVDACGGGSPRGRRAAPRCCARPWVSTKPTTTSVPRSCAPPALVEHGEGLADAGRGAEVDAQVAATHATSLSPSGPVPREDGVRIARGRREDRVRAVPFGCGRAYTGDMADLLFIADHRRPSSPSPLAVVPAVRPDHRARLRPRSTPTAPATWSPRRRVAMTADNVVGLVARRPDRRLPRAALVVPGEVLMTAAAWLQLARPRRARRRRHAAARAATWPRCSATARRPGDRVFAPGRAARSTALCGVDAEREQRWTVYACSLLAFSLVSVLAALPAPAAPGRRCRSTRPTSARVPEPLAFNTAVSFVTNTNWQNYAGEIDDEPPHPDGRPGGAELRVGRRRHLPWPSPSSAASSAAAVGHHRQLLGRPRPRRPCGSCCRSSFVVAVVLVSQGVDPELRRLHATVTTRRGRRRRSIPGGPVASQEAIKELGTNGGGSLNANSAHPLREPQRRSPTCCRSVLILADPVRPHLHLRADGQGPAAGLGRVRRHVRAVARRRRCSPSAFEVGGNPRARRRRASTRR